MKKLTLLALIALGFCSDSGISGVDQAFIVKKFKPNATIDSYIIDVDANGDCPRLEMDVNGIQVGFPDTINEQTTFAYADDEYFEEGNTRILKGQNDTSTDFELTFDGDEIYTIRISYRCAIAGDPDCVTTTYDCSGPLVD